MRRNKSAMGHTALPFAAHWSAALTTAAHRFGTHRSTGKFAARCWSAGVRRAARFARNRGVAVAAFRGAVHRSTTLTTAARRFGSHRTTGRFTARHRSAGMSRAARLARSRGAAVDTASRTDGRAGRFGARHWSARVRRAAGFARSWGAAVEAAWGAANG